MHLAASTAHEPLQASLSVDGVQHKEDGAASHETAPVAAAWDVPSMTPFAGGQPKVGGAPFLLAMYTIDNLRYAHRGCC